MKWLCLDIHLYYLNRTPQKHVCAEDQADVAVRQKATPGSGRCSPCRLGTRPPYNNLRMYLWLLQFAAYVLSSALTATC